MLIDQMPITSGDELGGSSAHLLDEVRRRLAEYRETGDPQLITESDMEAKMSALMESIVAHSDGSASPDAFAAEAFAVAATVTWHTADHVEPEVRDRVRSSAVGIAAMVYPLRPDLLPPALNEVCASQYGDGTVDGGGPLAWNSKAVRLLESQAGSGAAVEEAVALLRRAVAGTPRIHPGLVDYLSNLAHAYRRRFDISRTEADLDHAIDAVREALAVVVLEGERVGLLSDLGLALRQRYLSFGDESALNEAADVLGRAVEIVDDDDPGRWRCLNNLANTLCDRFDLTGDQLALDQAVSTSKVATTCIPYDEPFRASCLGNLGNLLHIRFDTTAAAADIRDAIVAYRMAIEAAGDSDTLLPTLHTGLVETALAVAARADDTVEWAEARETAISAVEHLPPSHPWRSHVVSCLASDRKPGGERGSDPPGPGTTADLRRRWLAARQRVGPRAGSARHVRDLIATLDEMVNAARGFEVAAIARDDTAIEISALLEAFSEPANVAVRPLINVTVAYAAWLRYLVLPLGQADDERDLALSLFSDGTAARLGVLDDSVQEVLDSAESAGDRHSTLALAAMAKKIAFTMQRADAAKDPSLAREAVALADEFLKQAPTGHPDTVPTLANQSAALCLRFEIDGCPADLDRAVQAARAALSYTGRARGRHTARTNLAVATKLTFDLKGTDAALDEAIEAYRDIVSDPAGHRQSGAELADFLRLLRERLDRGRPDEFDENISLVARVLRSEALAAEQGEHATVLAFYGALLYTRYEQSGQRENLDGAIAALRRATQVMPDVPAGIHAALASALRRSMRLSPDVAVLDEAIGSIHAASRDDATPTDRMILLRALADTLAERARYTGMTEDFDEAIATYRTILDLESDPMERVGTLVALGLAFADLASQSGNISNLDDAISCDEAALALLPRDATNRDIALGNLCINLTQRGASKGHQPDLDAGVQTAREALQAAGNGSPRRAWHLTNLGGALDARFRHSGHIDDLDAAVDAHRLAVDAVEMGEDFKDSGHYLSNLGAVLRLRGDYIGNMKDLEDAVAVHEAAVEATPAGHLERARRLSRYGVALHELGKRASDAARIRAAVDAHHGALAAIPENSAERFGSLINLASALDDWGEITGQLAARDEALSVLGHAMTLAGEDHERRLHVYQNLGTSLLERFQYGGATADLDEACALFMQGLDQAGPGSAMRAAFATSAGIALALRYAVGGVASDRTRAMEYLWEATSNVQGDRVRRISAARAFADLAMENGRPADALRALRIAIELLLAMAWQTADRPDRQRHLSRARGIGADAAAAAIACGDPVAAVELSEAARGVLWAQTLNLRTDLTALTDTVPELAYRLTEISRALDSKMEEDADGRDVDRRMALAREWDRLVEQVRHHEGLEDFLRPPPASNLATAAAGGPAILVNVSRSPSRGDALIVTCDGIQTVPLPKVTMESAVEWTTRYLSALTSLAEPTHNYELARHRVEDGDHTAESYLLYHQAKQDLRHAQQEQDAMLAAVLQWLWDAIVDPVLTALGYHEAPTAGTPWPRVWWCPTGPLALLPLHVAGDHATPEGRTRPTALDRVVSSFIPTLRALREAVRFNQPTESSRTMLVVAIPDAPGHNQLDNVARERDVLSGIFPGRHKVLEGRDATAAVVRAEMGRHRWVHFACHGAQDLDDPSHGGIQLYDTMLTISELSEQRHSGEFAFLAACQTATGGLALLDEAITLVSALHYTGYRHVIGALWSVYDSAAADISEAVYATLTVDGDLTPDHTAVALHEALRTMRDQHCLPLIAWAPFIHIGP